MHDEVKKYMSEQGKKSAARLTPDQRKQRALKAVRAREAKRKNTIKES